MVFMVNSTHRKVKFFVRVRGNTGNKMGSVYGGQTLSQPWESAAHYVKVFTDSTLNRASAVTLDAPLT